MFETLGQRLSGALNKLTGRGVLSAHDVDEALREVRIALLEADVALAVVKDFIERVRVRATGQDVIKAVAPGQQVIKIVHDELVRTLSGDDQDVGLNLQTAPPAVILVVGLQGAGKTTSSAKLAMRLTKDKKKVLLASLDVYRPAAQEQLQILAESVQIACLPIVQGEKPLVITKRALESAKKGGFDCLILDTAGRLHIDQDLMDEVTKVKALSKPIETLLVADALMGQDAVILADEFHKKVGISGIILTRIDGDGRGGAALSMRAVTGQAIKFIGSGEKLEALETFHSDRIAGRILGMGDVVSLVEKAMENVEQAEIERMAKRMEKGKFDLEDFLSQLSQVEKMGDLKGILGMLPGMGKMGAQLKNANIDPKLISRQKAIILSMTKGERKVPDIIKANRKKRIAAGSGCSIQDVNKLLKQHQQMAEMMKKMGKFGKMAGGMQALQNMMPTSPKQYGR